MKPPPTDLELVQAIYDLHVDDYVQGAKGEEKGMVPLDVDAVAARLGVEPVSVRGWLHYHLNPATGRGQRPRRPSI